MHPNRAFAWEDRDAMLGLRRATSPSARSASTGPCVVHAPVVVDGARPAPLPRLARQPRRGGARRRRAPSSPASARTPISAPTGTARPTRCRPGTISRSRRKGRCGGSTRTELAALLDDLSAEHEARLAPKPAWTRAKMSARPFEAMLKAIVGFELTDRGAARHPQARPAQAAAERDAAADGLAPFNPALAALMRAANEGPA